MVPPQHRVQLLPGTHPEYISNLMQICRRFSIRVVVPMSDAELLPIASARRELGRAGTRALIPSDRTLEFAADRLAMLQACEGLVPVPRYAVFDHVLEPATWEYPVVLRSRFGEGCCVIRSAEELDSHGRSLNLLVQEYLPGDEYSVDVFADSRGQIHSVVPRLRLTVDSGVLATTQVIRDPHLIEMATRVARRIDAGYATNVAFRQDGAGHLKLVRVKPRFRASKSGNGGANLPLLSLRALLEDTAPRGKPGGGGQYTKFMLSHEKSVTHSQMIIGGLMETLMKQIDHPLKIVELEGDALFLYSPKTSDSSLWDSRSHRLMKSLLRLFDIFRHRRAELAAYSVCRCEACANLGELKLKVVAHSGEALLNQVGDFSVLSGVDVITVHRLLKNSVDGNRYMLMTESAYRDLQPPDGFEVEEGVEEYDIGTLNTFVHFPTIPEDETMDIHGNFSDDNVAVKILRHEIQKEYTQVACEPNRGYHFNTGRVAAEMTEYRMEWLEGIPEHVVESFAGTGNPFSLGEIQPGEHVVDVGSGAGLDTMIAGGMVGGDGHVIGVDMTEAMIQKAKTGAQEARLPQVEFREGFAEALPVPDDWADVVISNGVVNLSPEKSLVLNEMLRVLRPGGRIQIADITVEKPVPEGAKQNIDLWTN